MTRHIGSQIRDTLRESGYRVVKRINSKEVILRECGASDCELWIKNDHYSGYTIEIGGFGYEYTHRVECPERRKSKNRRK